MISQVNTANGIGRFIPDTFVKSIELYKNNLKIDFFLKDYLGEDNNFQWCEEEKILQSVLLKAAIIADKKLAETIRDNPSLLLDPAYVSRNNILVIEKNISSLVSRENNLRSAKPKKDLDGKSYYIFSDYLLFQALNSKNIYSCVFSCVLNEQEKSKYSILGNVQFDTIIEEDKLVNAFLYTDRDNKLYKENDESEYTKVSVENYKVKDFRLIEQNPEIFKPNKKKKAREVSKLYITRSENNYAKGVFNINLDSLLYNNSEIYRFFSDYAENQNALDLLCRYSKIKNLIVRRYLKETSMVKTPITKEYGEYGSSLISSKDGQRSFIAVQNELGSLGELRGTNLSDNNKNRFFTFIDRDITNKKNGKYIYSLELTIVDGSKKFIVEDLIIGLNSTKDILEKYIKFVKKYEDDGYIFDEFNSIFEQEFKTQLKNNIQYLSSVAVLYYDAPVEDFIKLFSASLHHLSTNTALINKIFDFCQNLIALSNGLLKNIDSRDPEPININVGSGYRDSLIRSQIAFEQDFDAVIPSKFGVEYISTDTFENRKAADQKNSTLKIYTIPNLKSRVTAEVRRFFINDSPNITQNFNGAYSRYLSNQSLTKTKYSYFAPASYQFFDSYYDLISSATSNEVFSFLELESIIKNYEKNSGFFSTDKFANSFYTLAFDSFIVNNVNTTTKISNRGSEAKNISILSDNDPYSKTNSDQKLEAMKFVEFKEILDSKKEGLNEFFNVFDISSNSFLIKKLTDSSGLTDTQIQEKINNLPIQIKALLLKNSPQIANQINFNILQEKNNILFYPKLKFLFNLLKKIEFLSSIENNEEVWATLTELEINKLKTNSNFNYVLCRLSNYDSEIATEQGKNISTTIQEQLKMPVYNEYFLLNLENAPSIPETTELNAAFNEYSYKTEYINTFESTKKEKYDKIFVDSLSLE